VVQEDQNAMIQKILAESLRKEYTLKFNRKSSIYKKEEVLSESKFMLGGIDASSLMGSVSDDGVTNFLYKNVEEGISKTEKDFLGKIFLVTDTLKPMDWKLVNETKKIGDYTCFKATTTREAPLSAQSDTVKDRTVVVWYTPEVPISNGPDDYWGLPGLILEVSDGNRTILCDKVVLSTKEELTIKEPSRRKEHTLKEYNAIVKAKIEEMSDGKGTITIH
jgi:GLPGLI family protein